MKSIKFATIDDFSSAEIRKNRKFAGLNKARYYVTAFSCPVITGLVWRIKEHEKFINRHVVDVIGDIEKIITTYIKKQDLSECLKRKYIANIRQACKVAKEGL